MGERRLRVLSEESPIVMMRRRSMRIYLVHKRPRRRRCHDQRTGGHGQAPSRLEGQVALRLHDGVGEHTLLCNGQRGELFCIGANVCNARKCNKCRHGAADRTYEYIWLVWTSISSRLLRAQHRNMSTMDPLLDALLLDALLLDTFSPAYHGQY